MKSKHIKNLVLAALFAAAVFVATMFLQFPIPVAGYVNAGDIFVLSGAFFLGPVWGFFAGAIGSMLSDLILGYGVYAPATFIIKGLMAVVFALVCHSIVKEGAGALRVLRVALAAVLAEVVMVGGYFIFETLLYGTTTSLASLPFNCVQGAVGIVGSSVIVSVLQVNKPVMKIAFGK